MSKKDLVLTSIARKASYIHTRVFWKLYDNEGSRRVKSKGLFLCGDREAPSVTEGEMDVMRTWEWAATVCKKIRRLRREGSAQEIKVQFVFDIE